MAKLEYTTWEELNRNLNQGVPRKIGHNTEACMDANGRIDILLHGHRIVALERRRIEFSMCGYPTTTTRERINQFLAPFGGRIFQREGVQILELQNLPEHTLYVFQADSLNVLIPDTPMWTIDPYGSYIISEIPPWKIKSIDQMMLEDQILAGKSDESGLWPLATVR